MKRFIFLLIAVVIPAKADLPEKIQLRENVSFPIEFQGRAAGSVSVIKGTYVSIVKLDGKNVRVRHNNLEAAIPIEKTDLPEFLERESANARLEESARAERDKNQQQANAELQKKMDEEAQRLKDSLDFKGLKLLLSIKDLKRFFDSSLWCYEKQNIWLYGPPDLRQESQRIKLGLDEDNDLSKGGYTHEQKLDALAVGKVGVGADSQWVFWDSVYAVFYEGRIAKISVYGYDLPADQLKTRVLQWLELADRGLRKKYGEPSRVFFPLNNLNVLHSEAGFVTYIQRWDIGNQSITLGVVEGDFRYAPVIMYSDNELTKRMEEAAKGESKL